MATPYVKQTWADGDNTKPVSAARMGVIETGVFDAHYRPRCAVYASAPLGFASAAVAVITFDTELYDSNSMHSTVSNTARITAPVAGTYLITGRCVWVANATGTRTLQARLNGTTIIDDDSHEGSAASSRALLVSRQYLLAASDYVELLGNQTSGGSLNTGSGRSQLRFEMALLSY